MRYSEAKQGRTFIIRLEDGDVIHEILERFAAENNIKRAHMIIIGGADEGSRLVVGPEQARVAPICPMEHVLNEVHEVSGAGTIFPDETGKPILHMHIACGRNEDSITGCVRKGVKVWHVMEVILTELTDTDAIRARDPVTGFALLTP